MWGGMPLAVLSNDDADRASYLESLFDRVYFKDIIERYNLADDGYVLGTLVDVLASGIGSLTNPHRLALAMKSERKVDVSEPTVDSYVAHLEDSFLFNSAARWDVKGKRYLSYPSKYYMVDPGLRNARLNFRQTEYSHIMENVIYNDLLRRGYRVDVGVVETVEKDKDGKSVAVAVDRDDPHFLLSKKPVSAGEYYLGVICANVKKYDTSYSITTGLLAAV